MRDAGALGIVLVGNPVFYRRFGFENLPGLIHAGVQDVNVLGLVFTHKRPKGVITAHLAFGLDGGPW